MAKCGEFGGIAVHGRFLDLLVGLKLLSGTARPLPLVDAASHFLRSSREKGT
jgi:hypothetical protein